MRAPTGPGEMGRGELTDGRKRDCRGRKLAGFDNSTYKTLHKSAYHSYLVLFRVVEICRPSVTAAKNKWDFIPI